MEGTSTAGQGETRERERKWPVTEETSGLVWSALRTKPSSPRTKPEPGAEILHTCWPLRLEVYVPQSRTPVERGHWGRVELLWWSVCQLSVCLRVCLRSTQFTFHTHLLSPPTPCFTSPHTHSSLPSFYIISLLFLPIYHFLYPTLSLPPSLRSVPLPSSPHVILPSSPPSFKCWWAAEQYPGGHGDRQPPPCGLFLLLSLVLLLLGSCTLSTPHILA